MKQANYLIFMAALLLLLTACGNKQNQQSTTSPNENDEVQEEAQTEEASTEEEPNGYIAEGAVKADSAMLEIIEVVDQYGDETFSEEAHVDQISSYDVVEEGNRLTITFSTGLKVYQSTAVDGKWTEKDQLIWDSETDFPKELISQYPNLGVQKIVIKGDMFYVQTVGNDSNHAVHYHLLRSSNNGEIEVIDSVQTRDPLYFYITVSEGGNGVIRRMNWTKNESVLIVEGQESIAFEESFGLQGGYYDQGSGHLFYVTDYGVRRINLKEMEHLYDGADRKTTEDAEIVSGFEPGEYIYVTKTRRSKDYDAELYMYDQDLELLNSIEIPDNLQFREKGVPITVTSREVIYWKVHKYQDKPGLKMIRVSKPVFH